MSVRKKSNSSDRSYGTLTSLYRCLALLIQSAPRELSLSLVLNIVFGGGPAILLYLTKVIINHIGVLVKAPVGNAIMEIADNRTLLWSIVAFVVLNLMLDSVQTINGFVFYSLRDRLQGEIKGRIFKKVSEFEDISLFESPALLNTLHLAQENIQKTTQLANVLTNLMTGLFVFIPVLVLSLSIAWWIPILIFATAAPSVWIQLRYEDATYSVQGAQASISRKMGIAEQVLIGERYAKELRQFGLQSLFLERWRALFETALAQLTSVRKRGTYAVLTWSLFSGLGAALPYVFVLIRTLKGQYSLGDLAMYAGLVFEVRRSLFVIIGNSANLQGVLLASNALLNLLDLTPTNFAKTEDHELPIQNQANGMELKNVHFSYPGSSNMVLQDINLVVKPGEVVVVVGANGAGKTTLSKLLCRLYDPTEGTISIDGRDLRSFDLQELRNSIAVVNQDHAQFPVSVRENIGFGHLSSIGNDEDILLAAGDVGIRESIEKLPSGLDTPLTKQLDGGVDLSGGQWQRLAIARAILRHKHSKLLILDEPTASIDPNTEHEIFQVFKKLCVGKITFIVSHRLGIARLADQVVVMENGRVVELGKHDELMNYNGVYSEMFSRQASGYVSI